MPHAPILVPGVGQERLADAAATAWAMKRVADHAVAADPDTVVLISPHSPRMPGAFGLWRTSRLRGSLETFGSPNDRVDLPVDRSFTSRLEEEAARRGLHTWEIRGETLDHGAMVPLCYLVSSGWKGPTVILSLNYPGEGGLVELGQVIATTARALQRRTAIIASGDMSHRLTPSAPSGYHPRAHCFDETFIGLLRNDTPRKIPLIDPNLVEVAAEDVVDSTTIALGASDFRTEGHKVLSYEGPFGVGYGVAILFEPPASKETGAPTEEAGKRMIDRYEDLPAVARCALETELRTGRAVPPFQSAGKLTERHGVFVTLRTVDGELRGCVGTLQPSEGDLMHETWRNAVAAALHDNRFPTVSAAELPNLRLSVTVLGSLEPVASPAELDPAEYGVIVTAANGRKGVLLPAVEGIDSIEQQLEVARGKAGLGPDEPVALQRFKAVSFKEPQVSRDGN